MNFVCNGTDEEDYKHMNRNILDGNVVNMPLIIIGGKYGDIDADDSSCHSYYIIKSSSSPYTLQADFIIDGQVISSSEILCEQTYLLSMSINSHYYVYQQKKHEHNFFLRTILNGNVNVICYN